MGPKHSQVGGYIPSVRLAFGLLVCLASRAVAQASPYLPIDHPASPLVEWLIARGDLPDPSRQIRPLRIGDVIAALDSSRLDPASTAGKVAAAVRELLRPPRHDAWYRIEPRGGLQSFTSARRDQLHPGGVGGTRAYFEVPMSAGFGALVLASRPIAENRLKLDPDWSGRFVQGTKNQAYRFADAYLAAQFKYARLFFGQTERNWGPPGSLGLSIANYGYPRTDLALEVVLRDVRIQIVGASLPAMQSTGGAEQRRYFLAHRLNARVTKRLDLAIWETMLLAGTAESTPSGGALNPLLLFSFPLQLGLPDERNTIIGGDLSWRVSPGLDLQAQAMIDDRWRRRADSVTGEGAHPGRWAFTVAASGALGSRAAWRASVSAVSSLAYRTADSAQSFLDRGIGIGPHFTDLVRFDSRLEIPVRPRWFVTPELALLRQGEGRIDQPFPAGVALTRTPDLFIGRAATTARIGAGLTVFERGVAIRGSGGWQRTSNADHIVGRRRSRFEARLEATIGTVFSGAFQ